MPTRRLGLLFAYALLVVGCGDSGNTLLIGVGADDTVGFYDLYVFDQATQEIVKETGWSPVAKDLTSTPLKIGLKFPGPGNYTLIIVGSDQAPDANNKPVPGAKQFYYARTFAVNGNAEADGTLLHVPAGDDTDRDLVPDAVDWPQHVPSAAAIDVALLDCDDKMTFKGKNGEDIKPEQINPFFSKELCNGVDERCNGDADEPCMDSDGDGDPDVSDCDKMDPKVHHPTQADPFPESANCCGYNLGKTGAAANMSFDSDPICHKPTCGDGIDQDCDGSDVKCFADADCDGYRAKDPQPGNCAPPDKDQAPDGKLDCNDCPMGGAAIHPNIKEVCGNNVDDNCNGQVDEGCVGCDLDGDGFERNDPMNGCNGMGPFDCNDEDAGVFPGSTGMAFPVNPKLTYLPAVLATCKDAEGVSVCGALRGTCRNKNVDGSSPQDADCDGTPRKSCPPANCDVDGDGYMDGAKEAQCDPNHTSQDDCNDNDATAFPNAPSLCGETFAHSCSGGPITCAQGMDKDGDGYAGQFDCDDNNPSIHPFAVEKCNGFDDDCDGLVDEGNPDAAGVAMVKNGAVQTCNDSNVGECKPLVGHCVCSASPVDKLYFDQVSRTSGKTACPGEDAEVDTGGRKADVAPRCYGAIQPAPQSCNPMNPKDDDCDGRVDAPNGLNANVPPLFGSPIPVVGMNTICWPGAVGQCAPTGKTAKVIGCDMSKVNCYAVRGVNPWYLCEASVCPTQQEKCNGFDDDCDGTLPVNERDLDGDKYLGCGSAFGMYSSGQVCEQMLAPGLLGCGDCADSVGSTPGLNNAPINNNLINPGAMDVCDGADNDCNPTNQEGLADCTNNPMKQLCCAKNGCKNVAADVNNCNTCGNVCVEANAVPACVNASCAIQSCNAPFLDCDVSPGNGCEINSNTDPNHCGACPNNCSGNNIAVRTCTNGSCSGNCNGGFLDCDGNKLNNGCEINSLTDPMHCGGCPNNCSNNNIGAPTCTNGTCSGNCNANFADCDMNKLTNGCEINLLTDALHCGGCPNACSGINIAMPTCAGGVCSGTCNNGFADCDGNKLNNGCEINLNTDPTHCGACLNKVCSNNHVSMTQCTGGMCTSPCSANFADCNADKLTDGCETSTTTTANCAGCGNVCAAVNIQNASAGCTGATCFYTCQAGWKDCQQTAPNLNGCETHIDVDTVNCGDCNRGCNGTQVAGLACAGGLCTSTCNAGFGNCVKPIAPAADDGCETAITTSTTHCGACGRACNNTQVAALACAGGLCTSTCNAGYSNCLKPVAPGADDGCETHTAVDILNCGACGTVCSVSNISVLCTNGVCNGACNGGFADCNGNKQTDGCETPLNTTSNCSACNAVCDSINSNGASCNGATCSYTSCKANRANCNSTAPDTNGCETDTTQVTNCAGCGNVCDTVNSQGRTCDGVKCSYTGCNAGRANCNTSGVDTNGCETNILTDVLNCTGCGNVCDSVNSTGRACNGAKCTYTGCNAGRGNCDTSGLDTNGCETNTNTDVLNCTGCGNVCDNTNSTGRMCNGTKCTYSGCNAGFANCNTSGLDTNGCETNINTDVLNCTGCGNVCDNATSTGRMCNGSKCTYTGCSAGYANCNTSGLDTNGCETHVSVDPLNCTACGVVCDNATSTGRACNGTKCTYTGCSAGYTNCDSSGLDSNGCETHTAVDADNCAGCGNVCDNVNSTGRACNGTKCTYTGCNGGRANCDTSGVDTNGCETDTTTVTNCAGCGNVCDNVNSTGRMCNGTKCTYGGCNAGRANCDTSGVDTNGCETDITTATNCGSCGNDCTAGTFDKACVMGGCGCNVDGDCGGAKPMCNMGAHKCM